MISAAILVSLICIGWLARFDPKRRRSFGLRPRKAVVPRHLVWGGAALPGLVLALTGCSAGFVLWLAALCVFGWLVVWVPPPVYRAWRKSLAARLRARLR
ncbi:MAG: hypothetical protein AAF636_26045 [Pseudomonadota bacterium]